MITDVHTHILPAIDDGAKDIETSLELLGMMQSQGIGRVIATPHFYAADTNIEKFMQKRENALDEVINVAEDKNIKIPEIKLGAEVYYFKGIGDSDGIRELTLGQSDYMLFELARAPITDSVIRDILNLYNGLGLSPIFAHIERYAHEKGFKKVLELIDDGIAIAQLNAESVLEFSTKRTALKLIKQGYISFLGTDTHSLHSRPPKMDRAIAEIKSKIGSSYADRLIENGNELFSEI